VEQEQKLRAKAESERDSLQKQLQGVKDLLLADGGKTINNETLERIRSENASNPKSLSKADLHEHQKAVRGFLHPAKKDRNLFLPGADPTITSYNASVVKFYNATNCTAYF
jgi:hypothetical protein